VILFNDFYKKCLFLCLVKLCKLANSSFRGNKNIFIMKKIAFALSLFFSVATVCAQNDSIESQQIEEVSIESENNTEDVATIPAVVSDSAAVAEVKAPEVVVDDVTVLSDVDKALPDSARLAKEKQMMREFNPKDSLLEEKKVPEKRFITVGFSGGLNMTTYGLAGMDDQSASFGPGAELAINCDIPLGQTPVCQYLSIQPELIFSFRTTNLDLLVPMVDEAGDFVQYHKYTATDRLFYMNIPINFKASMRFKKGRPFVSLAPMLGIGLFGKRVSDGTPDLNYEDDGMADDGDCRSTLLFQADTQHAQEDPLYNNVDFSLYTKLGYDFDKGWSVYAAFQFGFVDLMAADGLMKTRCLSLNVGYNF